MSKRPTLIVTKKLSKEEENKQKLKIIKDKIEKGEKLTIKDINIKLDIILEMLQELKPKR